MSTAFKPTMFANMTAGEKTNAEFIAQHLEYYKTATTEGENHTEFKQLFKQAKSLAEREQRQAGQSERYAQLVDEHDIYHVAKTDKLYKRTAGSQMYQEFPFNGLCRTLNVPVSKDGQELLMSALRNAGRAKETVTVTYRDVPDTVLNMLGKPNFLQPSPHYADEDKFWFDLLLDSVSGCEQGVRDHIESAIAYKYRHPETFELPMWLPYGKGSGGAGKNVFVNGPIATIWGDAVSVTNRDGVLGQWTGGMLGKMFIMIDENVNAQDDFNTLKAIIGNERIDVNFKNGQKLYDQDNTAMYMMTCNKPTCPIKLTDTAIDRRFSVWQIKRDILQVLAERIGLPYSPDEDSEDKKALIKLFAENKHRFKNRDAVAGWLGEILTKWHHLTVAPAAYRGPEYRTAVDDGKGPHEKAYEEVFEWDQFTYISFDALYLRYVSLVREESPYTHPRGKNKFLGDVRATVELNWPGIESVDINVYDMAEKKYRRRWVFAKADLERGRKVDNDSVFVDDFKKHKPLWTKVDDRASVQGKRLKLVSFDDPLDREQDEKH